MDNLQQNFLNIVILEKNVAEYHETILGPLIYPWCFQTAVDGQKAERIPVKNLDQFYAMQDGNRDNSPQATASFIADFNDVYGNSQFYNYVDNAGYLTTPQSQQEYLATIFKYDRAEDKFTDDLFPVYNGTPFYFRSCLLHMFDIMINKTDITGEAELGFILQVQQHNLKQLQNTEKTLHQLVVKNLGWDEKIHDKLDERYQLYYPNLVTQDDKEWRNRLNAMGPQPKPAG